MTAQVYRPGTAFPGRIGLTADQSTPAWPRPVRAPFDAPNVLIIVLDDVGFAHLGCFGSPIRTATFDALAADGLRYVNFHTAGLSSPTRSCILTGRNHHANGMGAMPEVASGFPGYDAVTSFANGYLSEILRESGYTTLAVGKWHLTPPEQLGAAGPYERWPLGRGFDRYYGFLGGDTSQYHPDLVYDNHQITPPGAPEDGYHLTEDLVDRAVDFIADTKQVAPDRPFLLYFAPGACHAPHHVPREWPDKYRLAFDDGWETYRQEALERQKRMGVVPSDAALSHPDPDVPRWESLSDDERRVFARTMEVFAGFLEHADHHIGRLVEFLRSIQELENTLTIVVSDNGASPEGGPTAAIHEERYFNRVPKSMSDDLAALEGLGGPEFYNHCHWGWAHAGNTPFRRREEGDVPRRRVGSLHRPLAGWNGGSRRDPGAVRPRHRPGADRPGRRRHRAAPSDPRCHPEPPPWRQLPTHLRGRGGGKPAHDPMLRAVRAPGSLPRRLARRLPLSGKELPRSLGAQLRTGPAVLDRSAARAGGARLGALQSRRRHLRAVQPRLRAPGSTPGLIAIWYAEAGRHGVLPLHGPDNSRFLIERPHEGRARKRYVYFPRTQAVPDHAAVSVLNRTHTITADVEIPVEGAEGVLLSHGGNVGGYTLFVQDGRLHYVHNYVGAKVHHLVSDEAVPAGRATLAMRFEKTGEPDLENGKGAPGTATLEINGRRAGRLEMALAVPILIALGEGLTCGWDSGSPTTHLYRPPFRFTGTLHRVTVEVEGEAVTDSWAAWRRARARE